MLWVIVCEKCLPRLLPSGALSNQRISCLRIVSYYPCSICVLRIAKVGSVPSPYLGNVEEQKSWRWPFSFFKIPSSSIFVLALKILQISQNSAKSCVVLLQKEQLLILENQDFCKNKSEYQSISYERACDKLD